VLRLIRNLVYGLGFWPKVGTIFHSPSLAFMLSYRKAVEKMKYPVVIDLNNRSAWDEVAETVDLMELETNDVDPRSALYRSMNFCPMCGTLLVGLVVDVKQCPHLHGTARTHDGPDGLPAILFKPAEGLDG
jgi:hypothetical protein